jgi:protein arginine kinase activator
MIPCQSCHKRPATVHLTEIADGEKREIHLCEQCAQKEDSLMSPLNPQAFFAQLMDAAKGSRGEDVEVDCPVCGLSYNEFRQRGRLGCAECYRVFREGLVQLLEKIHGTTQHLGKVPTRAGSGMKKDREIVELKRELTRVIQREEYEKAAQLRDRIRRLEEGLETGEANRGGN